MRHLQNSSQWALLRCFCAVLLVFEISLQAVSLVDCANGRMFRLAHEPGIGLAAITMETSQQNVVQRTRTPVKLSQFDSIRNDVEIFHRAMELKVEKYASVPPEDVEREKANQHIDDQLPKQASPNLLARIKQAGRDFIAPAKSYYSLIKRYRSWRHEWTALRRRVGQVPNSLSKTNPREDNFLLHDYLHVMRLEYARLDQELMMDACATNQTVEGVDLGTLERERENENIDFMLKIIKRLIDRLEKKLSSLRNKSVEEVLSVVQSQQDDELSAERAIEQIEHQVSAASDRAKRIVANSLADVTVNEFLVVVRLLAYNSLASFVSKSATASGGRGLTARLEPIVLLLGNANASLLSSYLRDIQFRAGLNFINYAACKFRQTKQEMVSTTSAPTTAGNNNWLKSNDQSLIKRIYSRGRR